MREIYELAELYDEQYESYRDDIPFYLRLADDQGGEILELGAGTGRLTAALAGAGHRVVGLERSPAMLARARERLHAPLAARRVELVEGDMREVRLEHRFALVLAPFNTLMHLPTLADQDAALATARTHLESGGAFAFDLFTPRFGPMGVLRREAEWRRVGGEGAELFLVQEHDPAAQTVTTTYYLDVVGADGLVRRRKALLTQRYFTRFEIERALRSAGFGEIRLFGGFDRRSPHPEAPNIVGIARR